MAPVDAHFPVPVLSDNPDGWGPTTLPEQYKSIPYAPFNKSDKVGRAADWTSQGYRGRYDRDRGGGGGVNAAFSFFGTEDEDQFQLVDSKPVAKPRYGPRRFFQQGGRFGGRGWGRGEEARRDGRDSGAGADRERQRRERQQLAKRGQWGGGGYFDNRNQQRVQLNSSVDIRPEWTVLEQIQLSQLSKLSFNPGEPQEITTCGSLEFYNKAFDRVTPRSEKPLGRSESRRFPRVTASEDPILKRIGEKDESAVVFVTDNVISTLMCAPRSVYSWDVVVQRSGNRLFFDLREGAADLLTVNESATNVEVVQDESLNSMQSLSQEATTINQIFSQQVLMKNGARHKFAEPSPFASEGEETASAAYRYSKWKLDEGVSLVLRSKLDAVVESKGGEVFATVNALNEFDPKVTGVDWRAKIENQRGAVLATELKNNSNKIAKWTAQALLAGAEMMKLGYVSRVYPKDKNKHVVLAVQAYKPKELASQIALSAANMWGILKHFVDMSLALPEGKYLLVKDPNKPVLRLYEVPKDAFKNDYLEEPLPEDEQAPPPESEDGATEPAAESKEEQA